MRRSKYPDKTYRQNKQTDNSYMVRISVVLIRETANGFLISDERKVKGRKTAWLPKSLCYLYIEKGDLHRMSLPRWLAERNGLI